MKIIILLYFINFLCSNNNNEIINWVESEFDFISANQTKLSDYNIEIYELDKSEIDKKIKQYQIYFKEIESYLKKSIESDKSYQDKYSFYELSDKLIFVGNVYESLHEISYLKDELAKMGDIHVLSSEGKLEYIELQIALVMNYEQIQDITVGYEIEKELIDNIVSFNDEIKKNTDTNLKSLYLPSVFYSAYLSSLNKEKFSESDFYLEMAEVYGKIYNTDVYLHMMLERLAKLSSENLVERELILKEIYSIFDLIDYLEQIGIIQDLKDSNAYTLDEIYENNNNKISKLTNSGEIVHGIYSKLIQCYQVTNQADSVIKYLRKLPKTNLYQFECYYDGNCDNLSDDEKINLLNYQLNILNSESYWQTNPIRLDSIKSEINVIREQILDIINNSSDIFLLQPHHNFAYELILSHTEDFSILDILKFAKRYLNAIEDEIIKNNFNYPDKIWHLRFYSDTIQLLKDSGALEINKLLELKENEDAEQIFKNINSILEESIYFFSQNINDRSNYELKIMNLENKILKNDFDLYQPSYFSSDNKYKNSIYKEVNDRGLKILGEIEQIQTQYTDEITDSDNYGLEKIESMKISTLWTSAFANYWLRNYDLSTNYLLEAIKYIDYLQPWDKITFYYDLGENYVALENYKSAIHYLKKSKKELDNILSNHRNNESYKNIIENYSEIIQLMNYCYFKLGTNEPLIAELDYYKSVQTKKSLNINFDTSFLMNKILVNMNDNPNHMILIYTNVSSESLYEITGSSEIAKPIVIAITSESIKSMQLQPDILLSSFANEPDIEQSSILSLANSNLLDLISIKDIKQLPRILNIYYEFLIEPIQIPEYIKEITIIPESELYEIPFDALIDNQGNYLISNYNISYVNSVSMLFREKDRNVKNNNLKALGIGNPNYNFDQISDKDFMKDNYSLRNLDMSLYSGTSLIDIFQKKGYSNFSNLPNSKRELEMLQSFFGSSLILSESEASERNLKKMSQNDNLIEYDIIHFACHGIFDENYPRLSSLVLSTDIYTDDNNEGFLTFEEVGNLKLDAELINLSACSSGRGDKRVIDGVDGLVQSFFNAGANSVLASLWQLNDQAAYSFMRSFYKNSIENQDYTTSEKFSKALRICKLELINDKKNTLYNHPYYWAPYTYFYKK